MPTETRNALKDQSAADRLSREAVFHDKAFTEDLRRGTNRFYRITRDSASYYQELVRKYSAQGSTLEYGCGVGSQALSIARNGGAVVGIDISPAAIELARADAAVARTGDRATFEVMNAERLEFRESSFDLVCGSGILHHLDLSNAFAEIARVLKPGGRGVFFEPLGHNPLINLYRRLTPALRTRDEHPLVRRDITLAKTVFPSVEADYFHLLTIGTAFMPRQLEGLYQSIASSVDRLLLHRRSPFRHQAWIVVLQLRKLSD